ncbi:putative protein PIH1D3 [Paratrimastix pyriformis]|uniref:PIH1D1/2/3 CS-like domain-containing protein n=1 Tax=Paratrimastix pyriformis TaxID=342808 RepID=A0ABQ8UFZ6_9EUKA|nr:putative protein PIH1D3 [Paratrimastix pyriformis]
MSMSDFGFTPGDMEGLTSLLTTQVDKEIQAREKAQRAAEEAPQDYQSDQPAPAPHYSGPMNPGDIGRRPPPVTRAKPKQVGPPKYEKPSNDIWSADEVGDETYDAPDGRAAPQYDFLYKQHVTAEDVYLGLGGKDPSSAQCEDLVVKIDLPGDRMADVNLDLTSDTLVLRSKIQSVIGCVPCCAYHYIQSVIGCVPCCVFARVLRSRIHKLHIHLPRRVREKDGQAKWSPAKQQLTVTLPIVRTHIYVVFLYGLEPVGLIIWDGSHNFFIPSGFIYGTGLIG